MTADRATVTPRQGRVGLLIAAGALAGVWLSSLAVLALRTANPVTVNRGQLLSSDVVVVATPRSPQGKGPGVSLRVERALKGEPPEMLQVGGVEAERFSDPGPYLIPLRETAAGFDVTPAPPALNGVPLIYPATAETVRTAESVLATGAAKPYE